MDTLFRKCAVGGLAIAVWLISVQAVQAGPSPKEFAQVVKQALKGDSEPLKTLARQMGMAEQREDDNGSDGGFQFITVEDILSMEAEKVEVFLDDRKIGGRLDVVLRVHAGAEDNQTVGYFFFSQVNNQWRYLGGLQNYSREGDETEPTYYSFSGFDHWVAAIPFTFTGTGIYQQTVSLVVLNGEPLQKPLSVTIGGYLAWSSDSPEYEMESGGLRAHVDRGKFYLTLEDVRIAYHSPGKSAADEDAELYEGDEDDDAPPLLSVLGKITYEVTPTDVEPARLEDDLPADANGDLAICDPLLFPEQYFALIKSAIEVSTKEQRQQIGTFLRLFDASKARDALIAMIVNGEW